ncbi:hypothetical protein [Rhodopirellula sp. SWK7]|uniref:hypothetical protein n=1 Tax=Rhodopirellula sp. SWK7 TaxID=595460 RepID=UPI0002BF9FEE|nr:hypothetical protein [Rhodopirellula sp. SWK7]EMI44517.1 hypothetical protein RRSWK_03021 [Rhodopirellula sp. SWK7]
MVSTEETHATASLSIYRGISQAKLPPQSWTEIVQIEGRLGELAKHAEASGKQFRGRRSVAWWRRWESIKREASRHVGWNAQEEPLATSTVYEITIAELFAAFSGRRKAGR